MNALMNKPTLNRICFLSSLTLALTMLASFLGCETQGGLSFSQSKPITREEAVAIWSLTDSENELFNMILSADGSAVDTWWKGEDGAKGERGRWELVNGTIDIRLNSGWRDVISRSALGYDKLGYPPGLAPGSGPQKEAVNSGQAVKVSGDDLRFVGVWIIPGALAGPKYELYTALRSDGMAMKSIDAINQGTWQIESGIAHLYWADGWHTTIEPVDDGTFFSKSWKPGLALNEMPSGSAAVRRVMK